MLQNLKRNIRWACVNLDLEKLMKFACGFEVGRALQEEQEERKVFDSSWSCMCKNEMKLVCKEYLGDNFSCSNKV